MGKYWFGTSKDGQFIGQESRKPSEIPESDLPGGPEGTLRLTTLIGLSLFHGMALFAMVFRNDLWYNDIALCRCQFLLQCIVGVSSTGGAHRLFVHQAYEAKAPLQAFYGIFVWASMTGSPIGWLKSHKTHHKHSDTDLDPHNSHIGFWHSHFGWTLWDPCDAIKREKVCALQGFVLPHEAWHVFMDKFYEPIGLIITFMLPVAFLRLFWGVPMESMNWIGIFWTTWMRLALGLNMAASVNSLAHTFGERPDNPNIEARNNLFVSIFTWGEGWHNYHHAFPKDYRASSQNNFFVYWNPTAAFILAMAYLGQAYNLKEGCKADDPDCAVSVAGFHYKYRFPDEKNKKLLAEKKKKLNAKKVG